jgi:hypothetical protein
VSHYRHVSQKLFLHEAISLVLQDEGRALSTTDIAALVNARVLYRRGEERPVRASQISARVRHHASLFSVENRLVSLR